MGMIRAFLDRLANKPTEIDSLKFKFFLIHFSIWVAGIYTGALVWVSSTVAYLTLSVINYCVVFLLVGVMTAELLNNFARGKK